MSAPGLLESAAVYLGAAIIAVPIFKKLGLGAVIGYLVSGIAIGPWGLGLIKDTEAILHFAEFGVVLFLFLVGLELNPRTLWTMRKSILGTGGLQVSITMAVFYAIGMLIGLDWKVSLVASMGLALSSTAMALQILSEKNILSTPAGQNGFSILLFQDLAVIPMLALLPLLATVADTGIEQNKWVILLKIISVIAAIIIGGRYLIRPVFRFIASTGIREITTAFSLFLVIGIALMMKAVDLSMALGTFLAGVLLAESEYRHQLETEIEPFKGLLLGLFFISVGMSIDFGLLLKYPSIIAMIVVGLVLIKGLILFFLGRFSKVAQPQQYLFSFVLSQGGEFAFVLFNLAYSSAILSPEVTGILIVSVAISMATTPLLMVLNDKVIEPRYENINQQTMPEVEEMVESPVVIAGYGRYGQIVGRLLKANKINTTVIDHDPTHIERIRRFGIKVYYGEATRLDLLHTAGLDKAKILVLAIDDKEAMLEVADLVNHNFPHVKIIARAWDVVHEYDLLDHGVTVISRETFLSALQLGEEALTELGLSRHQAHRAAKHFSKHDKESNAELYKVRDDIKQVVSISQSASLELEKLLEKDAINIQTNRDEGWDK